MEDRPPSNLSFTAEELVNNALERARHAVMNELKETDQFSDNEIKNISWVTCRDFTVEGGKRQIAEYMRTWEVHPGWLFTLSYLRTSEEEYHTLHHYRARWSIPTPAKPIPKETVCVDVVVDVSKVKPQTLPVEVRFVVEGSRLVHTAGRTRFREKWLADVAESKALLRSAIDF